MQVKNKFTKGKLSICQLSTCTLDKSHYIDSKKTAKECFELFNLFLFFLSL